MRNRARALMIQGTGSDVGKTLIVAGLCRAFRNRGLAVLPFKPQNMANNAMVTRDSGEIGRAQALQARACGVEPTVDMNPVLLKPQAANGCQVIVRGRVFGQTTGAAYQNMKPVLRHAVETSFHALAASADLVFVEGAGSAAEVNLRANDIANMGFARSQDVPVVLVGDIDRGGVIAQIVGTKAVIDAQDAAMIVGFIVNKLRGDPALFADGMTCITAKTGWRGLGLVPFLPSAALLPAEDTQILREARRGAAKGAVKVVVPMLPGIANFDDLDPLRMERALDVVFLPMGSALPGDAALVILPGSKTTIADLTAFRAEGWHIDLAAHLRRGNRVLGLCGGYQMLGRSINDPLGIEGCPGSCEGLGLLDVETELTPTKILSLSQGRTVSDGVGFKGYEMHMGRTAGDHCRRPMVAFEDGRVDGAQSADGRVAGCYVHGLFNDDRQRAAWVTRLGGSASDFTYEATIDKTLDGLADHLATHVDLEEILGIAR